MLFLTSELIVEAKRSKLIFYMNLFKAFIFQQGLNFEVIFSQIKISSHEINLLCDRVYKHEVEENRKVLAPIIDTVDTIVARFTFL